MSALGLDSSSLILPAPTDTDSVIAPTDLGTELSHNDQQSVYSLPSDGTPVTITTRKPRARSSTGQASFMIELFEGGSQVSGIERKPSVRVRVTPSITKSTHSGSRHSEGRSRPSRRSELDYIEDQLMSPYASATEESTVSRNNDGEVERVIISKSRSKRPLSPLIPEPRMSNPPNASGQALNNPTGSDLSAIPTNSFLDDSGNSGYGENKRSASPLLKNRDQKPSRQGERERIRLADKPLEKEQKRSKSKSGRSRASSLSAVQKERERERARVREGEDIDGQSHLSYRDSHRSSKSRTRRSSRGANAQDSILSGVDSTVSSSVSRAHDGQSVRSSEVNSKLLAAVEVALRKVVIPELEAIKRENSKRDSSRRLSGESYVTGVSVDDRSEVPRAKRRSSRSRHRRSDCDRDRDRDCDRDCEHELEKERGRNEDRDHDVEPKHERALSRSRVMSPESVDEYYAETPKRSPEQRPARVSTGGSLANAIPSIISSRGPSPPPPAKKSRRRRREHTRKRASDRYDEEFDDESIAPLPPMPLQSEINPSEPGTRISLMTENDRPPSAMEELDANKSEVSDGGALLKPDNKAPQIGMNLANVSHGDLRALPRGADNQDAHKQDRGPAPFPEEYEPDEYGQKVRNQPSQMDQPQYDHQVQQAEPEDYERDEYDSFYGQQVVPPHLKYVPYQPERRGLSPIYSVSGYTENSEIQPRDSHITTHSEMDYPQSPPMSSPPQNRRSSLLSNGGMVNSEITEGPVQSEISSTAGYHRNPAHTEEMSELEEPEPQQPVRTLSTNANARIIPGAAVESVIASLIDGSCVEQSVTSPNYGYSGPESALSYGGPRSAISYGGDSNMSFEDPNMVHQLIIKKKQSDVFMIDALAIDEEDEEDEGEDLDEDDYDDGSKTPTAEEKAAFAAITTGALARAVQAQQIQISNEPKDVPEASHDAGVQRNKSFKERTQEGYEPASTPAHSIDRFYDDEYDNEPRLSANAMPDFNDPMPHYGDHMDMASEVTASTLDDHHVDETRDLAHEPAELSFVAGADDNISIAPIKDADDYDKHNNLTPRALSPKKSSPAARTSEERFSPEPFASDELPRTSTDRKRETILTNPYENMSPIASQRLSETFGYSREPPKDEGYVSNPTPDNFLDKGMSMPSAPTFGGMNMDDNLFGGRLSALSFGVGSPMNDTSVLTNNNGGNIGNKDIMTMMQELVARDAQRNARDTEIAAMVMFLANEMRTHFRTVEDRIKQAEDVIIEEVQDSEKMVIKAINSPRPYQGHSVSRSLAEGTAAGNSSSAGPEIALVAKKGNILRRALNGLNVTGAKDLSRIEVMLHQLLDEVMELKGQQGQPPVHADSTFSQLPGDNDTRDGYDPEGHAGTSVASQSSYAGLSSTTRLDKPDRKYQDHRVSTVHEGEEEDLTAQMYPLNEDGTSTPIRTNTNANTGPRGEPIAMSSTPCREPVISPVVSAHASPAPGESSPKSNAKSDKSRKHKSAGSSIGARISRWSETTQSTLSKAFRSSTGSSKKEQPYSNIADGRSRSGSDFGTYPDHLYRPRTAPYPNERANTGFSQHDLGRTPSPVVAGTPPPMASHMTPDHPKYQVHRNSLNLQHPQPRPGNTERFKNNLETQAHNYDTVNTPRSADWGNSVTSLNQFNPTIMTRNTQTSGDSAPPRPPKEPIETTTPRSNRISKVMQQESPHCDSGGYGGYGNGSPRSRDLERLAGMPTRRPSGPRAMTPKSPSEEAREERRRNRNTFGSMASRTSQATADTDTF